MVSTGEEVNVTFTTELSGAVTKSTIGDGLTVDQLVFAVYDVNKNELTGLRQNDITITPGQPTTVQTTVVSGEYYYFVFWAQKKGTGFYDTSDMKAIMANYIGAANAEERDAFFAVRSGKIGSLNTTVKLTRPLSQINFGTADKVTAEAAGISVAKSKITVKGVADQFNALTKSFSFSDDAKRDEIVTFDSSAIPNGELSVKGTQYQYLGMTYVFPSSSNTQSIHDLTAQFTLSNGHNISISVPNAPIFYNSRTNVIGNLLTSDAQFTVTVSGEWNNGEEIVLDEVKRMLQTIRYGADVTLPYDIAITDGDKMLVNAGKTSTLDLNGHKFENNSVYANGSSAIDVRGELTINGDGEVRRIGGGKSDQAILVQDGGKLIINGGTYSVGADMNGKGNSCIHVTLNTYTQKSGSVEIYGGTFSTDAANDNEYYSVLNQDNDITTGPCFKVYGGTFINYDPADGDDNDPNDTYVAEGYQSTKVSSNPDVYVVTKVGVTPVLGQEGLTAAFDEIKDVAAGSNVGIQLPAGEFTTYGNASLKNKDVTVSYIGAGADKTTFAVGADNHVGGEANGDYSLDGVTKASFKNMTIKVDNDNYRGYIRVKELEFENCVFENRISYWGTGKVSFKNCTFNQANEDYNLWTYSGSEFIFNGCTFNCVGKCINAYKEQHDEYKMTFKDCLFISSKVNKSVVELKANAGTEYELHFEGKNDVRGFASSKVTGYTQFNSNDGETDSIVSFGSNVVWKNGAVVE